MIKQFFRRFQLRPFGNQPSRQLMPVLTASVLHGISEVFFAVSVGSLIFSGKLTPYLAHGIGIALVTAIITLISTSLMSYIPGVIGSLQDSPSVILALTIAALVSGASPHTVENQLGTILTIIPLTAFLTGVIFLGLGYFKLGGLVRFIPYPVVGGFLAGTGWLLVQGSFGTMTGLQLMASNIKQLVLPNQLALWLPGVIFAFTLFIGLLRFKHFLTMPVILIGSISAFYFALLVTGTSINQAISRGLLLGGLQGEIIWEPVKIEYLRQADWTAILNQSGNIAILLIMSLIDLLLNASALELITEKDLEFNHELRVAGIANILSGFSGGMVGYQTLSASAINHRIGARSRIVGLLAAIICATMLFAGSNLLVLFPRAIMGGLLFYLGLEFLYEWVIKGWQKLPRLDYFITILILIVIASTNFLIGVGIGLVATIFLFVLNYSQVKIIRHTLSGKERHSNVERPVHLQRKLRELGAKIYILELQGFIFFGTASSLLDQVKSRLSDTSQSPLRYIIYDFCRVSGLDSSAIFSFMKSRQLVETQNIDLIFTNISDQVNQQLKFGGLYTGDSRVRVFPDLDRGLEWCENQLLDRLELLKTDVFSNLPVRLEESGFQKEYVCQLFTYMEKVFIAKGEYLIQQGETSCDLYFVESGQLSIYLELGKESRARLQTLATRIAVGEIGMYLGTPRTASIIADAPSVIYRLSRTALMEMREKAPYLAAALHEFIAQQLAERLEDTTRLLATLYD